MIHPISKIRSNTAASLCIALLFCIVYSNSVFAQNESPVKKPLKVFILAGQSNMEGHGRVTTFGHIGMDPKTAPMLEKMLGPDGKPREIDGVHIASLRGLTLEEDQVGKLTVGYGAQKLGPKIGPEYTFGIYMHEALQEPVLLIKTAWGGRSLNYHFRPPSAGKWTPPPGHPDLTAKEEAKPAPLPIPKTLDLPVGYTPGKEYLNPYTSLPGFYLFKGMRGCAIGQHSGVHPIYVCQNIKIKADGFPLKKGDLILGLNGEGLREDPKEHWRTLVYGELMNSPDWTLKVERWRDGKIESVVIDLAALELPGGKADIPKVFEERELARIEREKKTGMHYHLMIDYTKKVLGDIKRVYPDYDPAQGYEIAGFVWFQGWNDMVSADTYPNRDKPRGYEQYSWLLGHFIRDVRKDLNVPAMPFVIGVLGVNGKNEEFRNFREAMAAPANDPEFKGTVQAVQTADYWDEQLARLSQVASTVASKKTELATEKGLKGDGLEKALAEFETSVWTPEEKAIYQAGVSNAGFHYLGSAKMIGQFGKAFAESMLDLRKHHKEPAKN